MPLRAQLIRVSDGFTNGSPTEEKQLRDDFSPTLTSTAAQQQHPGRPFPGRARKSTVAASGGVSPDFVIKSGAIASTIHSFSGRRSERVSSSRKAASGRSFPDIGKRSDSNRDDYSPTVREDVAHRTLADIAAATSSRFSPTW